MATVYYNYLCLHDQARSENETMQSTDRFLVGALEEKGGIFW